MEYLLTLCYLLLFFLTCIFTILIPGTVLLSIRNDSARESDDYIYAFVIGIALLLVLLYVAFWLGQPLFALVILVGVNIYGFIKKIKISHWKIHLDKQAYYIISIGSLLFIGLVWFSGWNIGGTEHYYGVNAEDGFIHFARIHNITHTFPPTHPGLSGIVFNGYHYFYDLLLAGFYKLFRFSISDLYFRFFPLILAPIYGLSFLYIAKRFTNDDLKIRLVIIFAYFSAGFSSLISLFGSGFSPNFAQPLALMVGPAVILSVSISLVILSRLPMITKHKNEWILIGLLVGILAQLKVYSGLIVIAVLVGYCLYHIIRNRKQGIWRLIATNALAALLTIVTFFPNNFGGSGNLYFSPLLVYSHFLQQPFFNSLQWENKRLVYAAHDNYVRIALLYIQAFIIYWVSVLGVRIIALFYFTRLIRRQFWKNEYNFIVFLAIIFPIIFASLFIQTISVFDIVQFFWIAVVLLSIPSGILLGDLYVHRKRVAQIVLLIFLTTSILFIEREYSYAYGDNNSFTINSADNRVFSTVRDHVGEKYNILVMQKSEYNERGEIQLITDPPLLVAAKTGRSTYYENQKNDFLIGEEYQRRISTIHSMHYALKVCDQETFEEIVSDTDIHYLVVLFKSPCLATHSAFLKLKDSENIEFFQRKTNLQ